MPPEAEKPASGGIVFDLPNSTWFQIHPHSALNIDKERAVEFTIDFADMRVYNGSGEFILFAEGSSRMITAQTLQVVNADLLYLKWDGLGAKWLPIG